LSRNFIDYLNNKTQNYDKIDKDLIFNLWEQIKENFHLPKVIHIVGTNGKGSTGRLLALLLKHHGFSVAHYTSPHIESFNERIWLNGTLINDAELERAHQFLQSLQIKDIDQLSYFEYTTLLALKASQRCEYLILEAGLGGEFDATNIVPKVLSLITNIGYDHQSFLGQTLQEIATTKINSITKNAIIGFQTHDVIYQYAQDVARTKHAKLTILKDTITEDQYQEIKELVAKKGFASYFSENLALAQSALRELGIEHTIVQSIFELFDLPARFQKIATNIIIDAGHNLLAAQKIVNELESKKFTLIYNSFLDKDYQDIIKLFAPKIKEILVLPIEHERAVDTSTLLHFIKEQNIPTAIFEDIKEDNNYIVFGSFAVVEEFLKRF
jgi:dihydrofolate synthase/folylpolyglutamate synthase